jgi:hypothetical protein
MIIIIIKADIVMVATEPGKGNNNINSDSGGSNSNK